MDRPHRTRRVHIGKNISVIFSMASKEVKKLAGQNGSWEKHGLLCEPVDRRPNYSLLAFLKNKLRSLCGNLIQVVLICNCSVGYPVQWVHSYVVLSNVVLEHECSIEFLITQVTVWLLFLVTLQEVFVETTFVTEIFATFMTCDSRHFLRVGVHCGMSLVWLMNGSY